jgi:hypothetical protein
LTLIVVSIILSHNSPVVARHIKQHGKRVIIPLWNLTLDILLALLVNYKWLETILSFTKKRMKKPEPSKASFSSALFLIHTELNPKQDYQSLSSKIHSI